MFNFVQGSNVRALSYSISVFMNLFFGAVDFYTLLYVQYFLSHVGA